MWSVVIRIEEQAEDAGVDDIGHRLWRVGEIGEIGRLLHIGGSLVPSIGEAAGDLDVLPLLVAFEHIAVALAEHRLLHRFAHGLGHRL